MHPSRTSVHPYMTSMRDPSGKHVFFTSSLAIGIHNNLYAAY